MASPRVLTRLDLDEGRCTIPGCSHVNHNTEQQDIWIGARCHPTCRVDVRYTRGSGVLDIICGHCKTVVAHVLVAGPPS